MPSLTPELAALDAYRLKHDLTWPALAEAMRRRGFKVAYRTLHLHLKVRPARVLPNDRTLYKICEFLKVIALEQARSAKRTAQRDARRTTASL